MRTFVERLPPSWPPSYPMHMPALTAVARTLDAAARERYRLPESLLMERAALGVAACAAAWAPQTSASILVLCGPGDNGGDGYAAARQLAGWGRAVTVLDLSDVPARGAAARTQRELCLGVLSVESVCGRAAALERALDACDVVIDALFGVGLQRPLEGWWREAIACVNAAGRPALAVDVPSGLDADLGEARPIAIRAEATATMALPKPGLCAPAPGAQHAGRIVEIDIGLPWALHAPYIASAPARG